MPEYRHTQIGYVTLTAFAAALVVLALAAAAEGFTAGEGVLLAVVLAAGVMFATLTVEIREGVLRLWFGPRVFGRTIPLREIASAAAVRLPWYVGWGLRWWGFWVYNVSGRETVVIRRRDGRRVGVGTDEPAALLAALQRAGITVTEGA